MRPTPLSARWALTPPFHPYLSPCGPSAVSSLLHCLSARAAWPLASTLSCGARTFLSPLRASDRHVHFSRGAENRTRSRSFGGSAVAMTSPLLRRQDLVDNSLSAPASLPFLHTPPKRRRGTRTLTPFRAPACKCSPHRHSSRWAHLESNQDLTLIRRAFRTASTMRPVCPRHRFVPRQGRA